MGRSFVSFQGDTFMPPLAELPNSFYFQINSTISIYHQICYIVVALGG
jgi:hypothetical protein